jgi:peptide deformylase
MHHRLRQRWGICGHAEPGDPEGGRGIRTEEGCLSLLGGPRKTKRFRKIKVRWQNEAMQTRIKTFSDWTAQIIQHEVDHCNGILI